MKQFQYNKPGIGFVYGPYSREEAKNLVYVLSDWLDTAAVGDTAADKDGDIWVRLPDLKTDEDKQRDERLERIATPVFAAMINAYPMLSAHVLATTAVDFAKALIAELDKQA